MSRSCVLMEMSASLGAYAYARARLPPTRSEARVWAEIERVKEGEGSGD